MRKIFLTLAAAAIALTGSIVSVGAQSTASFVPEAVRDEAFELSIRNIMRAQENVGAAPSQIRWTDDSAWLYFRWRPGGLEWDAETFAV